MNASIIASILFPVFLLLAPAAIATTDGQPQRITTIGSWRVHDPVAPQDPNAERWTPGDVVAFLGRFPNAMMDSGIRDGYPPGDSEWRKVGALIDQARTIANAQGVPFAGRMCVTERPDVMVRSSLTGSCNPQIQGGGCDWEGDMDGEFGEAETVVKRSGVTTAGTETSLADARGDWAKDFWLHRLAVLRPGPGEERRRIIANTATAFSVDRAWLQPPRPGDRYEIRGSFDPAWIKRIPRSTHQDTVRRLWEEQRNVCGPRGAGAPCKPAAEALDPFDSANLRAWPDWIDRRAIEALATPTEVPALYGLIIDGVSNSSVPLVWHDPYFRVSTVVMDMTNPAYREWRIRYLMYKLRDYSLAPGAPACVRLTYKPGWYTFRDEAEHTPSPDVCAVPGSNLWTGPAHVCTDGSARGGPFVSGLYERGEFEDAVNVYIRATLTRLAEKGWSDLRLFTTERPSFGEKTWSILADDVRHSPKLLGEWGDELNPPLSLLGEVTPGAPNPAGDTTTDGAESGSTGAASAPPVGSDDTASGSPTGRNQANSPSAASAAPPVAGASPTSKGRGNYVKSGKGGGIIEPRSNP